MNSDQSAKPSTSSVASSATATSTQTSTETQSAAVSPTSTTDSSPTSTSTTGSSGSSSSSSSTASPGADSASTSSSGASTANAGVVAGGVIGGIAGLALLGMIILFLVKRERRRKEISEKNGDDANSRSSSSFGNVGPHREISKPILNEGGTFRSDFTRKVSTRSPPSFHSGAGLRDGDDGASYAGASIVDDFDDNVASLHEVPRSQPQQVATPQTRAVSSWYGTSYDPNDPARQSEYQPPIKMPSARAFGGNDAHVSIGRNWLGDPLGDYGGPSASSRETDADYINVFADSNALAPPPLDFAERRETRFSEFARQA